jgi:hypothetical protein
MREVQYLMIGTSVQATDKYIVYVISPPRSDVLHCVTTKRMIFSKTMIDSAT